MTPNRDNPASRGLARVLIHDHNYLVDSNLLLQKKQATKLAYGQGVGAGDERFSGNSLTVYAQGD